jgi:hypothetical protein
MSRTPTQLKAKGVDEIWCISVNDAFVMGAWGRDQKSTGIVRMMADGNAAFSKALGLDADFSKHGMGTRSQRYSMLVEDGVVKQLNVEQGGFDVSNAETMRLRSAAPFFVCRRETPDQPEVLLAQLRAGLSNHRSRLRALQQPEVRFLVARERRAALNGMRRGQMHGRRRGRRGQGIGRALLDQLALHALAAGVHELKLTTGIAPDRSDRLYERGFVRCAPYGGAIRGRHLMEKRL